MPPGQLIEGEAPLVTTFSIRRRLERGLRISLFVALCAILMFGPLALGIVEDWSTALFEIGAALILLTWTLWQLTAVEPKLRWSPLFAPMLAFFVIILVQIALHRTAYLHDSLSELWLYIAYGILTFVAVQLVRSDDRVIPRFGGALAIYRIHLCRFRGLAGLHLRRQNLLGYQTASGSGVRQLRESQPLRRIDGAPASNRPGACFQRLSSWPQSVVCWCLRLR